MLDDSYENFRQNEKNINIKNSINTNQINGVVDENNNHINLNLTNNNLYNYSFKLKFNSAN